MMNIENSAPIDSEVKTDRWVRASDGALAGVCKGLAQAFGIETWIMRVIWLIAFLWYGTGAFLYLILFICLPRVDRLDHAHDRKLLGVCARISLRYGVEVGLVRLAAVLFALSTLGLATFAYGICYFVIPTADEQVKSL